MRAPVRANQTVKENAGEPCMKEDYYCHYTNPRQRFLHFYGRNPGEESKSEINQIFGATVSAAGNQSSKFPIHQDSTPYLHQPPTVQYSYMYSLVFRWRVSDSLPILKPSPFLTLLLI